MGESFKNEVKIPVWVITVIISIMMSTLVYSATVGATSKEVEQHTKQIEQLQKEKADKEILNLILEGQRRIENKLDSHINEK